MTVSQAVWDVFVSYAHEDAAVAVPIANYLLKKGLAVWIDKRELTVGDSLRERIDHGLSQSRFGVVVLSPAFFSKHWTQRELNGLVQREENGKKVILPIWHGVDKDAVSKFSPPLADRLGVPWSAGLEAVGAELLRVIQPERSSVTFDEQLESPVLSALEGIQYDLIDDDIVSSAMAETNASGYSPDDIEVLSMGPLDVATVTAPFEATVHFTGEQECERMWLGTAITARISGTIRYDGEGWEVEEFEVDSAEVDDLDYDPDDD
jgi:hypothetical protein